MMTLERTAVHTDEAPKAIGPYSQAIKAGDLIFCSGQIPLDPATGKLVAGEIGAQTERVMKNLEAVLQAAGSGLHLVVKSTIFLVDLGDFSAVNEAYGRFFADTPPSRATVQVAALPLGSRVEIEVVALSG
jgi:2-iminobutanoate/2-iminopropanoate deaminase